MFTSMGKKAMRAAMNTFGMVPKPNHRTKRGAQTTTGVTFSMIASGYSPRSRKREWAMVTASRRAPNVPMSSPSSASPSVT